ncbi:uncharacterized protein LOC132701607 [Cylas formicarius]|uniref:uncharacterized protein LOC132701607 n=1 Tax=Cylas formicarius TaxID=197179 RepID=UPI002958824B|nr:uncharacterized protein LOC132701607 [Cylas formicarius]
MFHFPILLLTIHLWSLSQTNPVISTSSCKCWEDYQAEPTESGLECVALDQFHVMPCNMPHLPKCECSGGVSNILKDETGTWCTKYRKGEELTRWPCENTKDWNEFFKTNPNLVNTRYELCKSEKPPRCECSGDFGGIMKDRSGTWCISYTKNLTETKWPCENEDEWKKYYAKHPYFIYC